MKDTMALIFTSANEEDMGLRELTRTRSVAAVPFGGRYRVIDSVLSNLVHSEIDNVGLMTQKNYHSLIDHVGSGKEWDLSRKRDGLHILPPFVQTDTGSAIYGGFLDAIRANMAFLRRAPQRYALLTGSHNIFTTRYDEMFEFHRQMGADITMLYNVPTPEVGHGATRVHLNIDGDGRVRGVEMNPMFPQYPNVSMEVYLIEKSLLIYLVELTTAQSNMHTHFIRDAVMDRLDQLRVFGYRYDGYVGRMDSIWDYYRINMDLLDESIRVPLLSSPLPIYTKVKDEVPSRYGEGALVKNSLIADGCVIEGRVENSVLFRQVHVGRGSMVKDSILMQGTEVLDGANIQNVISDKDVLIRSNRQLMGQRTYPLVIEKSAVI